MFLAFLSLFWPTQSFSCPGDFPNVFIPTVFWLTWNFHAIHLENSTSRLHVVLPSDYIGCRVVSVKEFHVVRYFVKAAQVHLLRWSVSSSWFSFPIVIVWANYLSLLGVQFLHFVLFHVLCCFFTSGQLTFHCCTVQQRLCETKFSIR